MEPFATDPAAAPPPSGPSSAQKAVAIVAVMLGAMGIIGGCCGAVSNMASGAMLEAQGELLGAPGMPGAEQQRDLIAASQEIVAKWGPYVTLIQLLNVVASTLLLVTGVQVWRAHENAALLTFIASGSNAFVDIFSALLVVLQQLETQEMTRNLMPAGGDPNVDAAVQAGMQVGMMVGSCFAVGWLLAKLVSYTVMSVVMRRSR